MRRARRDRRMRAPGSYTGPDRANSAEHPVFGLRAGIDRATVAARLGPPTRSTTGEELLASYAKGALGDMSRLAGKEFWTYLGSLPDHDINLVLTGGVLESAEIARSGTGGSGSSGKGRILIARDGIHASTAGHAYLALSTILRAMPAVDAARLQAEYEGVRQSWTNAPGQTGSPLVISHLLVDDLTGDAALPGHTDFMLTPMPDQACVQLVSIIERPGERFGRGTAYRVWRTDGGRQWVLVRSTPRS